MANTIKPEDVEGRLLSVDAAAIYLGMSPAQIRKMVKAGILKVVPFERTMKFDKNYLDEWIESKLVNLGACTTITIGNQKGGVGKTTCAQNVSYELARSGYKVLAIDIDPQASLTSQLGKHGFARPTIYTLYNSFLEKEIIRTKESIVSTADHKGGHENLFLIPGDEKFSDTGNILNQDPRGRKSLKILLDEVRSDFDFIIIDTPPSHLDVIIQMALIASNYVLIPQTPDKMTTEAMARFANIVRHIKTYENESLKILGAIITRYKANTDAHKHMINNIKEVYDIFSTKINDRIQVHEAQIAKLPLAVYDAGYEIAKQYRDLVQEILQKLTEMGASIKIIKQG